jgi:hypothetical protein
MKNGDFHGHETVIFENEHFQLECLANAGPRIVRLIPTWTGENIFAELPDATIRTELGNYNYFGGHRLWFAPKIQSQVYFPDNHGVTVTEIKDGLKLVGSIEPDTHTRKSISIQTSPSRPFMMIKHMIRNHGTEPIRLAPCAITMLRPHSKALLPQQVGLVDKDGFLPNRNLSLWSYSRWDDPRLELGQDLIQIKADSSKRALRLGYFNVLGWLGYIFEDVFFVKRFGVRRDEEYPDNGCNAEVSVTDRMIELESLGAFADLKPEEELVHTETWEVYKTSDIPRELLNDKTLNEVLKQ